MDFGKISADYGRYRAGFPESFYERLATLGIGQAGQRILDLGTGTGTVARSLAARDCAVTAVDASPRMVEEATRLTRDAGLDVEYVVAPAEHTGLPAATFDAIVAAQCWHWFDRDGATSEVRRILVPQGRLALAHFDWLPLPGSVVEATEQLIREHNTGWNLAGGCGIYPQWFRDLAEGGFDQIESFSYDVITPYSHVAWRGRIRASAGVGGSLDAGAVERFDTALAALLANRFPQEPLETPHRVFAVVGTRR